MLLQKQDKSVQGEWSKNILVYFYFRAVATDAKGVKCATNLYKTDATGAATGTSNLVKGAWKAFR